MARNRFRDSSPRVYFRWFGWNWFSCDPCRMVKGVERMNYRSYGLYH